MMHHEITKDKQRKVGHLSACTIMINADEGKGNETTLAKDESREYLEIQLVS